MDSFASLDAFLAVAENLSFAEGARQLGLSPSATGKSIARLETRLGVRLFHRTTRRVSLTGEGELLLVQARRIRDDLRDTEAALSGSAADPQGRLRVSLPAIGYRFLASHLAAFVRDYPKIRLDLDLSDRIVDLAAEGIDVAIRGGTLANSTLMSRKLRRFRFMLCAAPAYIANHGKPESIAELGRHALVLFRYPGTEAMQKWTLQSAPSQDSARGKAAITCTNMEAVLAATIAGLGLSWMPDFLAADAIAKGELLRLLEDEETEGTFWLVWSAGRHTSPKLRAFIDFAAKHLFKN